MDFIILASFLDYYEQTSPISASSDVRSNWPCVVMYEASERSFKQDPVKLKIRLESLGYTHVTLSEADSIAINRACPREFISSSIELVKQLKVMGTDTDWSAISLEY